MDRSLQNTGVRSISPTLVANTRKQTSFGAVVDAGVASPGAGTGLESILITLDNSAGVATKDYMIGDARGILAALVGGTINDPDSVNGNATWVEAWKSTLSGNGAVVIGSINYASTTSAQFANSHRLVSGNQASRLVVDPFYPQKFARNNAQNDSLLTLEDLSITLSEWNGLLITVGIGETVTLVMNPSVAYSK